MKHYANLQLKMLNRQFTEVRMHPFIGYLLAVFGFIGLSILLFMKTEYANYIYVFISIFLTSKLSETQRITFLKICFLKSNFKKIRAIENTLSSFPFILFLIVKSNYISAIVLLFLSISLSFINIENKLNFTLPTPFKKHPFEFTIGFRKTILILLSSYGLALISVQVDNFNLGAFSLICSLLTCSTFYNSPENEFYVWIHSHNSKEFLFYKLKTMIVYSLLVSLPLFFLLIFFFTNNIFALLIVFTLGMFLILLSVLTKYAIYPRMVDLPLALLIGFSFVLFPSMIITIPYLFNKSIKNLKSILE